MEARLTEFAGEFKLKANQYSPLTLAFLGDGVFELFVRAKIVNNTNAAANTLHKKAVQYVKASAQCDAMDRIMPYLTEEEITMFKRGRNTKVNTRAKNASLAEYKKATGFETLIGFLYADGQMERLEFLLKTATDFE